tara:strand:+ start:476 stop:580 length:105 start_codon:yes stop_codon:yes gene_type:complete
VQQGGQASIEQQIEADIGVMLANLATMRVPPETV